MIPVRAPSHANNLRHRGNAALAYWLHWIYVRPLHLRRLILRQIRDESAPQIHVRDSDTMTYQNKAPRTCVRGAEEKSRQRPTFALRLSSALAGLTSVFGMGTGVTLPV